MALSQFDLAKMLRCPATDEAGYSCLLGPSHDGGHQWNRCQTIDAEGHHCMRQFRHSGAHEMPWYDSPAVPGRTQTLKYSGTMQQAEALSDAATRLVTAYGWVRVSQSFRLGLFWRSPAVATWLSFIGKPQGRLTVIFEYRPEDR
jgi:hypothetical protein